MKLPQHGGENKGDYKGHKSDMSLKQHGGEGKAVSKGNDMSLLLKNKSEDYCGPGRYIKIEKG